MTAASITEGDVMADGSCDGSWGFLAVRDSAMPRLCSYIRLVASKTASPVCWHASTLSIIFGWSRSAGSRALEVLACLFFVSSSSFNHCIFSILFFFHLILLSSVQFSFFLILSFFHLLLH
ncbi:uncharacterized protein TrAFT101_007533 [Trichoderma asperellum]|uniref:uncharacterized protein n=1 Tax=Trichoderma asperellum TaxID=101201 RepID=UPI0033298654|nr:hypothetical protein TrAFT101_007533 [Trichoderma asperellum]